MKQKQLFDNTELRMKLRKLTDEQINDLAIKHFGNLLYYYPDEILSFAKAIQQKLQGKNK